MTKKTVIIELTEEESNSTEPVELKVILRNSQEEQLGIYTNKYYFRKECPNKIDGSCPLPNIHCTYPDCEMIKSTT